MRQHHLKKIDIQKGFWVLKFRFKLKKLNSEGFSLIELLVVVLILGIVVGPFLHSFITATRTNVKASTTLTATNLAEATMEEFAAYKMESLLVKHPTYTYDASTKAYSFEFTGDYYNSSATDYTIKAKLDPSISDYSEYNNMSVADVENINGDYCAVYAMKIDEASSVYDVFEQRNREAAAADSSIYSIPAGLRGQLSGGLRRTIDITISSNGKIAIPNGDGTNSFIDHVKVTVKTTYKLNNNVVAGATIVPNTEQEMTYSETKEVYDNRSSKKEFSSIYFFFTPRSEAAVSDIINIYNVSNIPGYCYIVQENLYGGTPVERVQSINLIENPSWAVGVSSLSGQKSAMKIRTNLYKERTPMKLSDSQTYFRLSFKTPTKSFETTSQEELMRVLSVQSADGRNFDDSATKDKIYSLTLEVYKGTEKMCTMTGSKLE